MVKGMCGCCPAGCWIDATIDQGRLVSVAPDPTHPLGMLCTLGANSPDIVHAHERLQFPMRRVGAKGTLQFERISWEAAYDHIVTAMQAIKAQHGPEGMAIYTGRGSFERAMCDLFQPKGVAVSSASSVLFPFGSPNTSGVGALCYVSYAMIAPHVTHGGMLITMFSDVEQAELIVVWGTNPATDSPPMVMHQILDAQRRNGAEVVVIDPRRTETAHLADAQWLPIRSGTDGALALGMIEVLIHEELYDESFVRDWCVGFEELRAYSQHFTPERVATITGIPAATIRQLARRIAAAHGAAPVMYTGLEYSDSGVQAIRAVQILFALAGQLDVPGGLCFHMRKSLWPIPTATHQPNPHPSKAVGTDRFPIYSRYRGESHAAAFPKAVLEDDPYPIRGLIIDGASLITSWPQPQLWRQTLAKLDLLVVIDRQLTADAAYADIVLPATTYYEILSYMVYGPIFRIRERLLPPQGEARNDFLILAELAARLGYGHLYPQSEEEIVRTALAGSGYTLEQVRAAGGWVSLPTVMMEYRKWLIGGLRADGRDGFETPSGKFEIVSSILQEYGYEGLPRYTEPVEGPLGSPELAQHYPLVFNSGSRVVTDFRSQFHSVEGLSRIAPEPVVWLNSADAALRGIADGDLVEVVSPRGSVPVRAYVTEDIVVGNVDVSQGGGGPIGPEAWRTSNVNDLTDLQRYDPISGFPVYKSLLCDVRKVGGRASSDSPKPLLRDVRTPPPSVLARARSAAPPTAVRRRVYLDNNATTPLDPKVLEAMLPLLQQDFGNPSSIHSFGTTARTAVEEARRKVAALLHTTARRIVFTGGGSEADNLAIKGAAQANTAKGRHIIITAIEHPAVRNACRSLQGQGFAVTTLPVDGDGRVSPTQLEAALRPDTVLVSVMFANNEVGTIQPIKELCAIAHGAGALFHTDAVQAVGKVPLDVTDLDVDLLALSGHKLHGPKGVGALFVKAGTALRPLVDGGSQEHALRAGTENTAAIVGLGVAAELARHRLPHAGRLAELRDRLQAGILQIIPQARVNGDLQNRLPNTLSLVVPGTRGESLVMALDRKGIALSSGSACKAGSPDPSATLLAMGLSAQDAHCCIRLSLGHQTTIEEVDAALAGFKEAFSGKDESVRFLACR